MVETYKEIVEDTPEWEEATKQICIPGWSDI